MSLDAGNPKDEGSKFDGGKPSLSMISSRALLEEAKVMNYGEQKYDRDNWRKGMAWTRFIDAAMRHILAFNEGESIDEESGLHHLAHARCCLAFLLEYELTHPELDNRHKSMANKPKQTIQFFEAHDD
tara:strand:- start:2693 stop:3076 length:384 start_codon:yes stop_codon:yes gene_type:complete